MIEVSYIGRPKSRTVMYLTGKANVSLEPLRHVDDCTIFVDRDVTIPPDIASRHRFVISDNPVKAYVEFIEPLRNIRREELRAFIRSGRAVCEDAYIAAGVSLACGAVIGPGAVIEDGVTIRAGAVVRNCTVRAGAVIGENCVIGADAFTYYREGEELIAIPTLGRVEIGEGCGIGPGTVVAASTADMTIIGRHSRIGANCVIEHDNRIGTGCLIGDGVITGGYVGIGEKSVVGMRSVIKNRVVIGADAVIGMGSNVLKDVADGTTVYGNPARPR